MIYSYTWVSVAILTTPWSMEFLQALHFARLLFEYSARYGRSIVLNWTNSLICQKGIPSKASGNKNKLNNTTDYRMVYRASGCKLTFAELDGYIYILSYLCRRRSRMQLRGKSSWIVNFKPVTLRWFQSLNELVEFRFCSRF